MALSHMLEKIQVRLVDLCKEWDEESIEYSNQLEQLSPKSLSGRAIDAKSKLLIRCSTQVQNVIQEIEQLTEVALGEEASPPDDPERNEEIEDFIEDWYFDTASHDFAKTLCSFLFDFIDSLERDGLSERTIQKHLDNCWAIGKLECDYGYHDTFSPRLFVCEPAYLYDFKRKHSDSTYAVNSYKTTWRKLRKYAESLETTPPCDPSESV